MRPDGTFHYPLPPRYNPEEEARYARRVYDPHHPLHRVVIALVTLGIALLAITQPDPVPVNERPRPTDYALTNFSLPFNLN